MFKQTPKTPKLIQRVSLVAILGIAIVISFVTAISRSQQATAATSSTINFQARLLTAAGQVVPDGLYNVEFKLYDTESSGATSQGSCSGNCVWMETRTSGNRVRVANGYLTVNLGSVTAFGSTINWDQELWLTMNVGGTGSPSFDGEMTPRLKLTAVPYALRAGKLVGGSGSNVTVLDAGTPSGSNLIHLPAESGTLCIQNSANCGFALTGSGSFIQNGTTVQTNANFYIQSASASSVGGIIRGAASQTSSLFQLLDGTSGYSVAQFTNNGYLHLGSDNISRTGQIVFHDGTLSNTNTITLIAPTNVATSSKTITLPDETGTLCIQNSTNCGFALSGTGNFIQNQFVGPQSSSDFWISGTGRADTALQAPALRPTTNGTTAIQFQNAAGSATALSIDTTNSRVAIGNGGTVFAPQQALDVIGNLQVRDAATANKSYRFRTSGTDLDFESAGAKMYISNWTNADYTGTQRTYIVLENSANMVQAIGAWHFRTAADGTTRHLIDGTSGTGVVFNQNGEGTNFNVQGDTDANLFFIQGSTDRVGIGTNTPGYKLDVAGTFGASGNVTVGGTYNTNTFTSSSLQFGAAGTATISAAANQALDITGNAASTWSVSNGNLLITAQGNLNLGNGGGQTINLGTNNAQHTITVGNQSSTGVQAITIGSNANSGNSVSLESGSGGTLNLGASASDHTINVGTGAAAQTVNIGSTNSTSATTIQAGTAGINLSTTGNVVLGTADTTGTLLVLDSKTDTGDPTGVDGGMYYNSNTGTFRCYEGGSWTDCINKGTGGFPPVATTVSELFASNTTAHDVDMPTTVNVGDLLLTLFTNDGNATVTDPDGAGGWTEISTATRSTEARGSVWAKVATGTEGGTQVNFATSAIEQAAARVYHVLAEDWYGSIADGVAAAGFDPGTTTAAPDAPSLDPSVWGVEKTLWVTYAAGSSWDAVNSYPSGFTGGVHARTGTGTGAASVSSALRAEAIATQNPGAFSMNSAQSGVVFTVGIRPAPLADPSVTLQDAYNVSLGGTTAEIKLQNGQGGLDIQDANTTIGATESLFAVRGSNLSGLGTPYLSVLGNGNVGVGGATTPSRTLHVSVNTSSVNALPLLVEQAGSGDVGIQIKNTSTSYYLGIDTSDGGKFKISSSTSGTSSVLGYNSIGGSTDSSNSNFINATKFTASSTGTITNLYAYVASPIGSNPNNQAQMGIYADNSGTPGTLLASSSSITLTGNTWNAFTISPLSVTNGTVYWLAYNTNGTGSTQNNMRYTTGTTNQTRWVDQAFGTWPGSWSGGTFSNSQFSMYATIDGTNDSDNLGTGLFELSNTGQAMFRNNTNSTSAFQVKNAGNSAVLGVDTTNSRVGIGTGTPSRTLDVAFNNATTTAPDFRLYQGGSGDSSMEFANSSANYFMGLDATDNSFKISSGVASAGGLDVGDKTISGSTDSGNDPYVIGSQFTTPASAGTLNSISMYIVNATGTLKMGIYADNGSNAPGALLATSGEVTLSTSNSWYTIPISGSVSASTKYWVMYRLSSGSASFKLISGGGFLSSWKTTSYASAWPDPYGSATGTSSSSRWALYFTYTPSGSVDSFNTNLFKMNDTGRAVFKNSTNSSTAFQIQNASGTSIFNVDSSNGRVGIGTDAPSEALTVAGNFNVQNTGALTKQYRFRTNGSALDFEGGGADMYLSVWSGAGFTGTQTTHIIMDDASGSIRFPSVLTTPASGYTSLCIESVANREVRRSTSATTCTPSSIRYKENVNDLPEQMGLEAIAALRPVTYTYKADPHKRQSIGFIAEEVNNVLPQLVERNENGEIEALDYEYMVANLVKGIQQQQSQINSLRLRIDDLQRGLWNGGLVANDTRFKSLVTFDGRVSFKSDVTFEGKVNFKNKITYNQDAAGTVTIPEGETEVEVKFKQPYTTVPRVAVSASEFVTLKVSDKRVDGFIIKIRNPYTSDIVIDWVATQVEEVAASPEP
jgi:hypothetical protein